MKRFTAQPVRQNVFKVKVPSSTTSAQTVWSGGHQVNKKSPIEIWERIDGWTLEVYSRDPLDVSRTPMISSPYKHTYEYFVLAAQANGYGKKND